MRSSINGEDRILAAPKNADLREAISRTTLTVIAGRIALQVFLTHAERPHWYIAATGHDLRSACRALWPSGPGKIHCELRLGFRHGGFWFRRWPRKRRCRLQIRRREAGGRISGHRHETIASDDCLGSLFVRSYQRRLEVSFDGSRAELRSSSDPVGSVTYETALLVDQWFFHPFTWSRCSSKCCASLRLGDPWFRKNRWPMPLSPHRDGGDRQFPQHA